MKADLATGITLHYERTGHGPPLILIPGTSIDHETWRFQVPAYESEFTVISVDPRGAGQTTAPRDSSAYSTELMADDIAALMDVLDIDAAHISGLSLGSAIAQQIAIHHPQKVLSLQLHGTWAKSDARFRQFFTEPMLYFLKVGEMHRLFKFGQALIMSREYLETRAPKAVADQVSNCVVRSANPPTPFGFAGQLHADANHDALEGLTKIDIPTLVTAGEFDLNTPSYYGIEVHELIPNSTYHEFRGPRASHCACWEMAEEFNAVTLKYLQAQK